MATLRDLLMVYNEIDLAMSFFRASDDAVKRFNDLSDAARDAVIEENGCKSPDEALVLPQSIQLGERSFDAMNALRSFCPRS